MYNHDVLMELAAEKRPLDSERRLVAGSATVRGCALGFPGTRSFSSFGSFSPTSDKLMELTANGPRGTRETLRDWGGNRDSRANVDSSSCEGEEIMLKD